MKKASPFPQRPLSADDCVEARLTGCLELGRSELPRFGLSTMRERAGTLGGAFLLESSPGAGTRVTVELPTQPPNP